MVFIVFQISKHALRYVRTSSRFTFMKRENTHSRIKIHLNIVVIIIKSSMLGTNVGTTPSEAYPWKLLLPSKAEDTVYLSELKVCR